MSDTERDGPINRGDYVALVLLVTLGLIGTALFMAWLLEHRGMVAPGSSPFPTGTDEVLDDLEEPGGA